MGCSLGCNWEFEGRGGEGSGLELIDHNDNIPAHAHLAAKYLLFAWFRHLWGEPQSQTKYTRIVAYTLLDAASIVQVQVQVQVYGSVSLNAIHASGTGELKQQIHSPDRGSTRK